MYTHIKSLLAGLTMSAMLIAPAVPIMAQEDMSEAEERELLTDCRETHLAEYQTALRSATEVMTNALHNQWLRQVDFRVNAARGARRATVTRALARGTGQLDAALLQFTQAQLNTLNTDTDALLDLFLRFDGTAEDQQTDRWSNRTVAFQNLNRVLTQLERSLRLYASSRDRAIITRVWNGTREQAQSAFAQAREAARDAFVEDMDSCIDPEEAQADTANEAANTTPPPTPTPTPTPQPAALQVTRVVISNARDYTSPCQQKVTSRAQVYTNRPGRVSGYFVYHDNERSPEMVVDTDANHQAFAQYQRNFTAIADTVSTGKVYFVVSQPASNEFPAYTFDIKCQTTATNTDTTNNTANTNTPPATPAPFAQAVLEVEGNSTVSACGIHEFLFKGTITHSAAGTMRYYWETNTGDRSPEGSLSFTEAGTQQIKRLMSLSNSATGWMRLVVITPNATSAQTNFSLTQNCSTNNTNTNNTTNSTNSTNNTANSTPVPENFRVTGVMVSALGPQLVMDCVSHQITFVATIASNLTEANAAQAMGGVHYRWENPDLDVQYSDSDVMQLDITSAETTLRTTATVPRGYNGPLRLRLHVRFPNDVVSNTAAIQLSPPEGCHD